MKVAASSQLRTESVELGPMITHLQLKKITAASPDHVQSTSLAIARPGDHISRRGIAREVGEIIELPLF